jgi:PilZ domain
MGRRSEPRISFSCPVTVCGFDLQGRRFAVDTRTRDVSGSGASLEGINHLVQPGKKVQLEFGKKTAWYGVEWVGESGSSRAGRIGVRCLEKKYIWDIPPKPRELDTFDPKAPLAPRADRESMPSGSTPPGRPERRKYPRRTCRLEAQVCTVDCSENIAGKVTDISLGGCYVEMFSPLPLGCAIQVAIDLDGEELRATGTVQKSQMGLGMGVSFTGMSPADFERLRKFIPPETATSPASNNGAQLPRQPREDPQRGEIVSGATHSAHSAAQPSNGATADSPTAQALEAVVRALLRKGVLSREDLVEEFEKVQAVKQ